MDEIKISLDFTLEEALFIAESLLEKSDNTSIKFEDREKAYDLHDYIDKRILEECGEI